MIPVLYMQDNQTKLHNHGCSFFYCYSMILILKKVLSLVCPKNVRLYSSFQIIFTRDRFTP